MNFEGNVHRFGDHIDTDVIIPARYLNIKDAAHLALHCMEDIDSEFAKTVKPGDIMVAGKNFGCGSSREHAPLAIKTVGVSCVVAVSFARIFFRNAINIGLPIIELPEATQICGGDRLKISISQGIIENLTQGAQYSIQPFPEFMQELISKGGLISWVRSKIL